MVPSNSPQALFVSRIETQPYLAWNTMKYLETAKKKLQLSWFYRQSLLLFF